MPPQTLKQVFYVYFSTSWNITDLFMVDENTEMLQEINDDIEEYESNKKWQPVRRATNSIQTYLQTYHKSYNYPANRDAQLPRQEKQNKWGKIWRRVIWLKYHCFFKKNAWSLKRTSQITYTLNSVRNLIWHRQSLSIIYC